MTFHQLRDYIGKKMRMQHIYQPVMLMTLLRRKGKATRRQIAKEILTRDESQTDYYEQVVQNMVGDVLTKRRGITERDGHTYQLKGFEKLSEAQVAELMQLCRDKLDAYTEKWGERIFQHRKKSAGYISGTLRYEVLKRSKFHCELCGISAKEKALEVDHILPRNKGGGDDISNLQALCYSCNAMKRDRDDADFREVRESYDVREAGCPFCKMAKKRVVAEQPLAYAVRDGYPVSELHTLVIPKRHVADYFDLGRPEENACRLLLEEMKADILKRDKSVEGFNIGWNCGEVAGQTVFHAHVHLIPRRKGDVENPRGGVRHIIDGKGEY
jgi:diadenosine tetraphosphate (Ap4A) HIT family hydrolase